MKITKIGFILFFYLIPHLLIFAQRYDSLMQIVETTTNSRDKIDALNQLSEWLSYTNSDSSILFAEEAYKKAASEDYTKGEILALHMKSVNYIVGGENETAMDLLKQAELKSEKSGEKILLARTYMLEGDIYANTLLYDKAFEHYLDALKILEKTRDPNYYLACKNQLGILCAKLEKFDEAFKIFQEVRDEAKETDHKTALTASLNNIATANMSLGKYTDALEIYESMLDTNMKYRNFKFAIGNLGNIAEVNIYLGDTNNAIAYYNKSIRLSQKINDIFNGTFMKVEKYKLLYESKKWESIEDSLLNVYKISKKSEWFDLAMKSSFILASVYKEKGEYDSAFNYLSRHLDLKEIIESEGNTKKIAELQFKYDLEKETLMIEAKTRRRNIMLVALSVLFALVVVLAITLLVHFRMRAKKSILSTEKLMLEKDKLQLQQKNLTNELEIRNKEITSSLLLIQKKNEVFTSIASKLFSAKDEFTETNWEMVENCISELKDNSDDTDWKDFELHFSQVYESFYTKLNDICPKLTVNDRRLCAYIKLKMNSKEIAVLTNSTLRSIEVARYRLRKKLKINDSSVSINTFLENL